MNVGAALAALAALAVSPLAELPANRLDGALGSSRSLLSFLPDADSGRFAVHPDGMGVGDVAPWGGGEFWRTASGNVYTRFAPYDRALVTGATAPYLRDGYDGDELQLGFEDFVALHLGDTAHRRVVDHGCRAARAVHADALRSAAAALRPSWRDAGDSEVWIVEVAGLRRATAAARAAAQDACGVPRTPDSYPESPHFSLVVERSATRVDVGFANPHDTVPEVDPEVSVVVVRGRAGRPPADPRPAPAFTDAGIFRLSTNGCGGLPWSYGGTPVGARAVRLPVYTKPGSPYYRGPDDRYVYAWFCERDIPRVLEADTSIPIVRR